MTVADRVKAVIEKYETPGLYIGLVILGLSEALGSTMNVLLAIATS